MQRQGLCIKNMGMKRVYTFGSLTMGTKFRKEVADGHIFVKVSPTQYVEITANSTSSVLTQSNLEETVSLIRGNFYV